MVSQALASSEGRGCVKTPSGGTRPANTSGSRRSDVLEPDVQGDRVAAARERFHNRSVKVFCDWTVVRDWSIVRTRTSSLQVSTVAISVQDVKSLFDQFRLEEQKAFDNYLRAYKRNEKKRNLDNRSDDRGRLSFQWKPEDLVDKNLLVIGENGAGDEILTTACLAQLQSCCRHVVWRCDAKLKTLFQRSFPGAEFISADGSSPAVDGTIYSWELIQHFRRALDTFQWTTSGVFAPYLRTGLAREVLTARYRSGSLPLVGIAWRSESPVQGKTCDLKDVSGWATFFDRLRNRVHFVSLQYGDTQDAINFTRWKYGVEIYQDQSIDTWNDLDGVAAQVAVLDYVVSISTTVVHLAGALGRPGWVLLKHKPFAHWRAGEHVCLWYPTVRPVCQKSPGEWSSALEQVTNELAGIV